MSAPPLEVRALSKAYRRRPVLQDLSFSAAPGEALAIVGSNGAGKSTLLGCITGDRLPDGGSVRVCGTDPFSDLPSAARCMGFVPEQPFLYGELTVGEMLGFVAAARALDDAAAERDRLLELLQLDTATGLLCRELSQGMGRKVALIVALLHQPRLLVLDEALNGLDRVAIERVIAELDSRRAAGTAVLLSSHDLDFLAAWCDRGLLLGTGARWRKLSGDDWRQWRREPGLWSAAEASPTHS